MTDVAVREKGRVAQAPKDVAKLIEQREPTVMDLMALALDKGGDAVNQIERLVAMKITLEDRHAAQEFNQALAAFQSECPPIAKTSTAKIVTKGGGSYGYKYAELDEIARTVNPILSRHGLSYSWDSSVDGKVLSCTCIVRHINGHSITAHFTLPIDNASAMSEQQKVAAALTYARRQSLVQALGITTADPDNDGAGGESQKPITDDQALHLEEQIAFAEIDRERFLKYLGVSRIAGIPAANYTSALNAIETRKREKAKAGR